MSIDYAWNCVGCERVWCKRPVTQPASEVLLSILRRNVNGRTSSVCVCVCVRCVFLQHFEFESRPRVVLTSLPPGAHGTGCMTRNTPPPSRCTGHDLGYECNLVLRILSRFKTVTNFKIIYFTECRVSWTMKWVAQIKIYK